MSIRVGDLVRKRVSGGAGDGGTDHDKDKVPSLEDICDDGLVQPEHPADLGHREVGLAVRRVGGVPEDVRRADRRDRLRSVGGWCVCGGEGEKERNIAR